MFTATAQAFPAVTGFFHPSSSASAGEGAALFRRAALAAVLAGFAVVAAGGPAAVSSVEEQAAVLQDSVLPQQPEPVAPRRPPSGRTLEGTCPFPSCIFLDPPVQTHPLVELPSFRQPQRAPPRRSRAGCAVRGGQGSPTRGVRAGGASGRDRAGISRGIRSPRGGGRAGHVGETGGCCPSAGI